MACTRLGPLFLLRCRVAPQAYSSSMTLTSSSSHHHHACLTRCCTRMTDNKDVTYRRIHTSPRMSDIFTVQDEKDFQDKVLANKKPVVVQFHAGWCGPCKLLMPRMEQAMVNFSAKLDMAKVDIDDLPDLALKYNVGAVPSVLIIHNGAPTHKFVGLKDPDQIDKFLSDGLK